MYLMYVDESGDPGLSGSPVQYFILSGMVIHELRWSTYFEQLVNFRRRMKATYGLRLSDEIHAYEMINRPGDLVSIKRYNRLAILRHYADELAAMADLNIINVVIDKTGKLADYDVFGMAWKVLFQRFENTMSHRNFRGPANPDERGMIVTDVTDAKKVRQLLRQMRRYNPVPSQPQFSLGYRDLRVTNIIEDPSHRDSAHSYFIQSVNVVAYLLYQQLCPNSYMRKKQGHRYFNRLDPILCKVASSHDQQGIVRL